MNYPIDQYESLVIELFRDAQRAHDREYVTYGEIMRICSEPISPSRLQDTVSALSRSRKIKIRHSTLSSDAAAALTMHGHDEDREYVYKQISRRIDNGQTLTKIGMEMEIPRHLLLSAIKAAGYRRFCSNNTIVCKNKVTSK